MQIQAVVPATVVISSSVNLGSSKLMMFTRSDKIIAYMRPPFKEEGHKITQEASCFTPQLVYNDKVSEIRLAPVQVQPQISSKDI